MADVDQIANKLTQARQQLLNAVQGLSENQMAWSPDEAWSIREILHHVAIGEEANVQLAERALAGTPVVMEGFELDTWNVEQVSRRAGRSAAEALEILDRVRQRTLATLRSLSEESLAHRLHHPGWGEMTVEQLFRALGVHDLMHRRDILKRIELFETDS